MGLDFDPLDRAIEKSLEGGADEAEAFFERKKGISIKVFDLGVEKFGYSESLGMGLRVFAEGRPGRSYTSDLSGDSIDEAVSSAIDGARVSPVDRDRRLPPTGLFPAGAGGGDYLGGGLSIWDDDLDRVTAGEKIEFAIGLERKARDYDERVTGVETAAYQEASGEVLLASSEGFRAGFRASTCYGYLIAMAREGGDTQTGFGLTAGRSFGSLDAAEASREAASNAVDLLGGEQVKTRKAPVLLDNLSAAELLGALSVALSGEQVVKGKSFLAGKVGESIASERINVVDDGLLEGGFGTSPFDGEGVSSSRKRLIVGGILEGYLQNSYTALRTGGSTTGNASRSSYRSRIGVAPTNLFLEAGTSTPEELMSEMGEGFRVRELQGVHVGLNPVTGEISVGAKGVMVKDGAPAGAFREMTIAGTFEGLLRGIVGIGNDMRFTPLMGGIGAPSILIEGLVVGGG